MDLRKIVKDRLKELDWSAYRLVQTLSDKVPPAPIYKFLADDVDPKKGITSIHLGYILDALGLMVVAKKKGK